MLSSAEPRYAGIAEVGLSAHQPIISSPRVITRRQAFRCAASQLSKLGHSVLKVEPPASIACEKMRETALQSSGCILRISGFIFFFSNRFACFLFAQMKRDIQLVGCPFKDFRNNYRKSKDGGGEKERLFVCPEV